MVLEWGIDMILERGMMVSVVLKVTWFWDFGCVVMVSNCTDTFLLCKLNWKMSNLSLAV